MKAPGADPTGRLVSTLLDVLVAEVADASRLRRGRDYAHQGAVGPLHVSPGRVEADVQGSVAHPYHTSIEVFQVPVGSGRMIALVPGRRDVRFRCTCADLDLPCKHAVALMAQFSQRLAYDPSLFLLWRTGGDGRSSDTADRGGQPTRATAAAPTPIVAELPAADREALELFLGERPGASIGSEVPAAPLILTPLPNPMGMWDDVWAQMLGDALDVLRNPTGYQGRN